MSISHKGMSDPEEKVNFEPSWDLMSGRPSLCSLVPAQGSKHNLLPGTTSTLLRVVPGLVWNQRLLI